MKTRRIAAALCTVMLLCGLSGCGKKETIDQLAMPQAGDQVATISVAGYGDIKLRFFPEAAPKAVENFITHAKEGYYDGLTFHRVIRDFMIQGGDPEGNGTGGESIWGEGFGTEISKDLRHYRGALCMAMSQQPNSLGSQFYIVQAGAKNMSEVYLQQMEAQTGVSMTDSVKERYLKNGGTPWLDDSYTVFGQVYEGMEVVDAIAAVETDENDMPLTPVIVEAITVGAYSE